VIRQILDRLGVLPDLLPGLVVPKRNLNFSCTIIQFRLLKEAL
jgi:hypothetical protein